jgi:serine O-acetyltransferase
LLREDWRTVLAADFRAMGLPATWRARYHLTNRIALLMRLMRKAEALQTQRGQVDRLRYLVARLRYERLAERVGVDVPLGVFGPGLSIAHRGNVVVNGGARVGRNCRVHPGVLIGAHNGKSPTVGDDVFIGPNVVILGDIRIGDGVVIAANAVVREDVPEGSLVHPVSSVVREGKGGRWTESGGRIGPNMAADNSL